MTINKKQKILIGVYILLFFIIFIMLGQHDALSHSLDSFFNPYPSIARAAANDSNNFQTIYQNSDNRPVNFTQDNNLAQGNTLQMKQYVFYLSQAYKINYSQFYSVIECESAFRLLYGDSGRAFGIAQFHKDTFNTYCKGNYYNSYDQLTCMAQMVSQGKARQWTCFNKLYPSRI